MLDISRRPGLSRIRGSSRVPEISGTIDLIRSPVSSRIPDLFHGPELSPLLFSYLLRRSLDLSLLSLLPSFHRLCTLVWSDTPKLKKITRTEGPPGLTPKSSYVLCHA